MIIREYKNGNITIKLENENKNTSFESLVCDIANNLDWVDTYLISEYPYCLGNDCIAVDFYNIRTDKLYKLSSYDMDKYLLNGKTLRLLAFTPDKWDRENIDNYFNEEA